MFPKYGQLDLQRKQLAEVCVLMTTAKIMPFVNTQTSTHFHNAFVGYVLFELRINTFTRILLFLFCLTDSNYQREPCVVKPTDMFLNYAVIIIYKLKKKRSQLLVTLIEIYYFCTIWWNMNSFYNIKQFRWKYQRF